MDYRIITNEEPHSSVSEQYRKLRTAIDFSSFNEEMKVLNLTSTFPGEGKTITCLNLANVYAQSKQKTLIIDMDLRKPKIHRAFRLPNKGGVSGYITDDNDVMHYVEQADEYLHVMVSGEKVPFPAELLVSKKMKTLMNELREKYDKIIIDCPPMTAVTDASVIANFSDGTIYVTASRNTNGDVAKGCIKDLKQNGANVIGGILTRVKKRDLYYGVDYYYYGAE